MKNNKIFDNDMLKYNGYFYTQNISTSRHFNFENTKLNIAKGISKIPNKISELKVMDFGCGDGYFTNEFMQEHKPKSMLGLDILTNPIKSAQKKYQSKTLKFRTGSIDDILADNLFFDIVIIRGVLHHCDNPEEILAKITSCSKYILIMEPNGNNPILKIIEKTLKYHIEHNEKSFPLFTISKWLKNTGCRIKYKKYFSIIPVFCPDWFAKFLKTIEPFFEGLPFIRNFYCGLYVIIAETPSKKEHNKK